MVESGDKEYYGFEFKDCEGKVYKTRIETGDHTWNEVLNDFVKFLEGVYGYDIQSKIKVQEPMWLKWDTEGLWKWTGPRWTKEEDEEYDENSDYPGLSD